LAADLDKTKSGAATVIASDTSAKALPALALVRLVAGITLEYRPAVAAVTTAVSVQELLAATVAPESTNPVLPLSASAVPVQPVTTGPAITIGPGEVGNTSVRPILVTGTGLELMMLMVNSVVWLGPILTAANCLDMARGRNTSTVSAAWLLLVSMSPPPAICALLVMFPDTVAATFTLIVMAG
jgi:hypothetical protein